MITSEQLKGGTKYYAKNIPSGENWVIIGLNNTHVCASGWPPTITALDYMTDFEEVGPLDEKEIEYRNRTFGGGWK